MISLETVIELISYTTTQEGLVATASDDANIYPTAIKASVDVRKSLRFITNVTHKELPED